MTLNNQYVPYTIAVPILSAISSDAENNNLQMSRFNDIEEEFSGFFYDDCGSRSQNVAHVLRAELSLARKVGLTRRVDEILLMLEYLDKLQEEYKKLSDDGYGDQARRLTSVFQGVLESNNETFFFHWRQHETVNEIMIRNSAVFPNTLAAIEMYLDCSGKDSTN